MFHLRFTYKTTIAACFIGYIVQAIVNNFLPLLFLQLQREYAIPLSQITLLVTFNFGLQLLVDLLSTFFVDRLGYRRAAVLAHVCASAGFVLLTVLPGVMDPFAGVLISVLVYAVGGGLLEVLVSPIMESCPTENKEKAMSLLHSFYCWGHVGVVLLSTLFFRFAGIGHWRTLALLWAVVPLCNTVLFAKTPISEPTSADPAGGKLRPLFQNRLFWIFWLMMLCAGASEQSVSQWASAFAEKGLGVSKAVGDLAGPMAFAALMGSGRAFYGKYGDKIPLHRFMTVCGAVCAGSYLLVSLSPLPAFSLIGCGLTGLSVGVMWPGTFSKAAASIKNGGTAMFALLALAGDLGCAAGPSVVGAVSNAADGNLKTGILAAIGFPVGLMLCLLLEQRQKHRPGIDTVRQFQK